MDEKDLEEILDKLKEEENMAYGSEFWDGYGHGMSKSIEIIKEKMEEEK